MALLLLLALSSRCLPTRALAARGLALSTGHCDGEMLLYLFNGCIRGVLVEVVDAIWIEVVVGVVCAVCAVADGDDDKSCGGGCESYAMGSKFSGMMGWDGSSLSQAQGVPRVW